MDQNSTNGTDKRNWRERLGIGTKEMPRISDAMKPASVVPKAAAVVATVKPAPMAPRPAAKAAVPAARPATAPAAQPAAVVARPAAPVDSATLAAKLKSQREAAEKLAEQRVQAARQRAEAIIVTPTAAVASKPKFTFADDEPRKPAQPAAAPQRAPQGHSVQNSRPAVAPLQPPAPMTPPRPQLGAGAVPPRAPNPTYQPRPQQQQPMPPPPAYNPNLGYRPIDPNTGYTQPQYNPSQGFTPPPRQNPGFTQQPRLTVPPRGPQVSEYNYGQEQRPAPRLNNPSMRPPAAPQYGEADADDIFEQPAPRIQRRATATEYQQAYREAETGYEEEGQRSRLPLILLSFLLLALVVGGGTVWAYKNYWRPGVVSNIQSEVPVVKAPEMPAKVITDAAPVDAPAGGTVAPSKKQIYDRIVGDREVLGGQIVPTEETPIQPANNAQPVPTPDSQTLGEQIDPAAAGTDTDGTPLPLPPPPGDSGQQGSLEPSGKGDQQLETITPAASASQAADSPLVPITPPDSVATDAAVAPASDAIPDAPVPGEQAAVPEVEKPAEQVVDAAPLKKLVLPKAEVKKVTEVKTEKSLGSKPVVLVPPSKKINAAPLKVAVKAPAAQSVVDDGGLYGDAGVAADSVAAPIAPAPVKKRKSLFDLFKGSSQPAAADTAVATQQPTPVDVVPLKQVAVAQPVTPSVNGYVAQLASFKTKAEAAQQYKTLSAKHGAIITRYAPIITEAQVAGATRFRLSIGPMASTDVASGVCQSLFAAGERDCLVRRP